MADGSQHGHTNIDSFEVHDVDAIKNRLCTSKPFLIRAFAAEWRATKDWCVEGALAERGGDAVVEIAQSSTNVFNGDITQHTTRTAPFRDWLQMNDTDGAAAEESESDATVVEYVAQVPLYDACQSDVPLCALLRDIDTESWLRLLPAAVTGVCSINLWVNRGGKNTLRCTETEGTVTATEDDTVQNDTNPNGGGSVRDANTNTDSWDVYSTLHFDAHDNFLVVLHGQKNVTLYPPTSARQLGLHSITDPAPNHCTHATATQSDVEGGSRNLNIGCVTWTVSKGDALYIPQGWLHKVHTQGHTIAVNVWWPGPAWTKLSIPAGESSRCCLVAAPKLSSTNDGHAAIENEVQYVLRSGIAHLLTKRKRDIVMKQRASVIASWEEARLSAIAADCSQTQEVSDLVSDIDTGACIDEPVHKRARADDPACGDKTVAARRRLAMTAAVRSLTSTTPCSLTLHQQGQWLAALDLESHKTVLLAFISTQPQRLRNVLMALQPEDAEGLTQRWEEGTEQGVFDAALFQSMFAATGDSDAVFQSILQKRAAFSRQMLRETLQDVIGPVVMANQ